MIEPNLFINTNTVKLLRQNLDTSSFVVIIILYYPIKTHVILLKNTVENISMLKFCNFNSQMSLMLLFN